MTFKRSRSRFIFLEWLYEGFLRLIIYPSVWVAAALASLGFYTQVMLGLSHNWQAITLIFAAALVPYNLDRIFDSYVQKIPDAKAQLFFRKPCIWALLLLAVAVCVILLYNAPTQVRYVSLAGIIPLLYGIPLFPIKRKSKWQWYRLKDIPGAKAWIVGSVLTYAVVALPMAYAGAKFDLAAVLTTLFMFVFIVTNSHTFDIRDLNSDRQKGVITLPIAIGIRSTKIVLAAMNIVMLLTIVAGWLTNTLTFRPEIILSVVVNLLYIWMVNVATPRWAYNIAIEGCLFVPPLTYLVFHYKYF